MVTEVIESSEPNLGDYNTSKYMSLLSKTDLVKSGTCQNFEGKMRQPSKRKFWLYVIDQVVKTFHEMILSCAENIQDLARYK